MNQEILEGNKLIAEFMGASPEELLIKKYENGERYLIRRFDPFNVGKATVDKFVEYHSSWDQLMPVLIKIGNNTGHELVMHSEISYWNQFGDNALITEFLGYGYPLQDGIWKAVVEFTRWYNKNN